MTSVVIEPGRPGFLFPGDRCTGVGDAWLYVKIQKNSVVEIKLAYRYQLEAGMLVCECGSAPLGNLESNIEPHGSVRSASRHLSHTQG